MQASNPFALVLVDGDGYAFRDELIKAGADGGITAASLLSDSIKDLLHDRFATQAEHLRIKVHVYSNMSGLSKTLGRSGQALFTFVRGFNRAQDLFDYTDAGDKKEGADFKIRGQISRSNLCNSQLILYRTVSVVR